MGDTLYLLRAMGADPVSLHLARMIEEATGDPVVFVCDESRGPADVGGHRKIGMTRRDLAALGFDAPPDNWGWLWGDMCYQVAAARHPDFDAYCLMESDVFLPEAGAEDLLARLEDHPADAVAGRLRRYDDPQKFSRGLAQLGLDPHWGCIFPVSRVTRPVVAAMGALRRRAIRDCPGEKLNDEAMLAGAVQAGGFTHASLEDIAPDLVGPDTFETNPPHLFEALLARPDEERLHHPVVTLDTVLDRIASGQKNYHRHRLRKVLRGADAAQKARIMAALKAIA